jgi:hypothetical protein
MGSAGDGPTDRAVVDAAADAAESLVFSRYGPSEVADIDVTVHFKDGELTVDVYLHVPDADAAEQVAEDAAVAARAAVDAMLE